MGTPYRGKRNVIFFNSFFVEIQILIPVSLVIFQMAEVAVLRALFCEILYRIRQLMLMAIPSGAG